MRVDDAHLVDHQRGQPAGREAVDDFITEVSQDTWILFPWDTEPQFVAPLAKRGG